MDLWNVEVGSLYGWTLLKVPIILKNALDKGSLKLNFLQKNSGRISLSPQVMEAGSFKDLHSHSSALYFKSSKYLGPLTPFLGESEICVRWVSCRKFNNLNQLLFEAFFLYNWNFWQHSAQYIIIIYLKNNKCLASPSSTPVQDKEVRLLNFCIKYYFRQVLCKASEIGDVDTLTLFP